MEYILFWEASGCSVRQETAQYLWNPITPSSQDFVTGSELAEFSPKPLNIIFMFVLILFSRLHESIVSGHFPAISLTKIQNFVLIYHPYYSC